MKYKVTWYRAVSEEEVEAYDRGDALASCPLPDHLDINDGPYTVEVEEVDDE